MNDIAAVHVVDRRAELCCIGPDVALRNVLLSRSLFFDHLIEVSSGCVLHDNVQVVAVNKRRVVRDDVLVLQKRHDLRLLDSRQLMFRLHVLHHYLFEHVHLLALLSWRHRWQDFGCRQAGRLHVCCHLRIAEASLLLGSGCLLLEERLN